MAIELTTATTAQLSGIRQSLNISPFSINMLPEATYTTGSGGASFFLASLGSVINFKDCQKISSIRGPLSGPWGATFTTILNAQDLVSLKDVGTNSALHLGDCGLTNTLINQLFTDLPTTNQTATINVTNNPGAATCDTTIATNKGYTVVTS
jgi:hypothetical protein